MIAAYLLDRASERVSSGLSNDTSVVSAANFQGHRHMKKPTPGTPVPLAVQPLVCAKREVNAPTRAASDMRLGFALVKWLCVVTIALCSALSQSVVKAATVEIAGMKVDGAAEVAGAGLELNGAGVRYKGPFKVYLASLYLGKKVGSPEAVFAANGPKRVTLTMLRDVESGELGRLFIRSIQDNTPRNDLLKVLPALPRMGEIFAEQKSLAYGDSVTIDWVPGTGTVISAKGKVLGQPSKDPEFFQAMLAIWIGKAPVDWALKDALLGGQPRDPQARGTGAQRR